MDSKHNDWIIVVRVVRKVILHIGLSYTTLQRAIEGILPAANLIEIFSVVILMLQVSQGITMTGVHNLHEWVSKTLRLTLATFRAVPPERSR